VSRIATAGRARVVLAVAVAALACVAALCASDREAAAAPSPAAKAAKKKGGIGLKRVGRFRQPTYVSGAPGEKGVFVVEQAGRIRLLRKGKRSTFLDIRGKVLPGGEQGLLSVAFPSNYAQARLFYVFYVANSGDLAIEEYRAGRKRANRGSARRVLTVPHPGQSNHNGGQLQFGPDGFLYIGTGDGGGAGDPDDSAQDTNSLLGKILRIDPRSGGGNPYTSPGSNPFAGGPGRDEIYALGLRNPFRFSFDRVSAKAPRIVIGDVGQDRFEEVDYETVAGARGANFGWNDFEGNSPFSGANGGPPSRHDRPIKVYSLNGGACALIGGYVVASKKLKGLTGRYVYGDFCVGKLRSFIPRLRGARKDRGVGVTVPMLSSFGLGPGKTLYATSLNGSVFKLVRKRK
jgi:glucose/arabinose dehydrogenase